MLNPISISIFLSLRPLSVRLTASGRSATLKTFLSATTIALSIAFSSSLTFPGQLYAFINSMALSDMPTTYFPLFSRNTSIK